MKKCILVAVVVAGCCAAPPVTQQVDIPVFTPCVKEVPVRPNYEFGKVLITDADGDEVLALARDWTRGRKYEQKLAAVIAGCM